MKQYLPLLIAVAAIAMIWWYQTRLRTPGAGPAPLDALTDSIPRLFLASAGLAVATMAIMESFKRRWRSVFHAEALSHWFRSSPSFHMELPPGVRRLSSREALDEFLQRVAPRYREDVLGLPVEILSAQIGSAADGALSDPNDQTSLLLTLAGPGAEPIVLRYMDAAARLKRRDELDPSRRDATSFEESVSLADASLPARVVELRGEVGRRIQRNLDAFQTHVTAGWARDVRYRALVLASFLAFGIAVAFVDVRHNLAQTLAAVMTVGLLTGALAPIARDAVAVLERLRR